MTLCVELIDTFRFFLNSFDVCFNCFLYLFFLLENKLLLGLNGRNIAFGGTYQCKKIYFFFRSPEFGRPCWYTSIKILLSRSVSLFVCEVLLQYHWEFTGQVLLRGNFQHSRTFRGSCEVESYWKYVFLVCTLSLKEGEVSIFLPETLHVKTSLLEDFN